jgi:hypothetical protein
MSETGPLLDRTAERGSVPPAWRQLVARGDIYVIGGAAMAMAYDGRRSTRDIDAVFKPHGVVLEEARAVASELGLPLRGSMSRRAHMWLAGAIRRLRMYSTIPVFGCQLPRQSTCWP